VKFPNFVRMGNIVVSINPNSETLGYEAQTLGVAAGA
jgi:hypothetical protein